MGRGHIQSVTPTLTSYCPHLRAHGLGNAPTMGFIIRLRVSFCLGCCWHMRSYYVDLLYCLEEGQWHLINGYTRWLSLKKKSLKKLVKCHASWTIIFLLESYTTLLEICYSFVLGTLGRHLMKIGWWKFWMKKYMFSLVRMIDVIVGWVTIWLQSSHMSAF